jgi:hypothetical protein
MDKIVKLVRKIDLIDYYFSFVLLDLDDPYKHRKSPALLAHV